MKFQKRKNGNRKLSRFAIACLVALCMIAGMAVPDSGAYAATVKTASALNGSTYTHNTRFDGHVIANGVDVSYWQNANCNWASAKAAGVDYAIIRVTYSGGTGKNLSTNVDSKFQAHYTKAKAAGVMTGAYVFSQAKNADEAVKEATYAVNRLQALGIGPNDLDLPVYMDYEFYGGKLGRLYGISRTDSMNAALAFCNTIRSYGYTPGVYANLSFFNNQLNIGGFAADTDLWCAQYNSSCGLAAVYSKWQYSSSVKVNGLLNLIGVKGNVDANFWYLDPNSNLSPGVTVSDGGTYEYTGGPIEPAITVKNGSTKLKEGVDYKIGYLNNVNPGTAYAYIKGIGSYSGYKLVAFTITGDPISVPATKIKKLKGKKQAFYVKVAKKKKARVSGYQVKYSRNSDMSDSVTKTVGKKYNKVSKTIKTNARKRYYYVQVRSYKTTNGIKYYSAWSAVKKVKVK